MPIFSIIEDLSRGTLRGAFVNPAFGLPGRLR
jgi:hypothetical protein